MTQYVLVNSQNTIIWGPAEFPSEWLVNSNRIVPSTFTDANTPLEWYEWVEVNGTFDPLTQTRSEPSISFDSNTKTCTATYTLSEVDLATAKANRCAEINSYREELFQNGYTWNGHTYDANDAARANLSAGSLGAVCMGKAQDNTTPFTVWRTKDNQNVTLTGGMLVTLGLSMMNWYTQVMAKSWYHKDAINALTAEPDIRNYDIGADWPT